MLKMGICAAQSYKDSLGMLLSRVEKKPVFLNQKKNHLPFKKMFNNLPEDRKTTLSSLSIEI
jgi:hypothetical protein